MSDRPVPAHRGVVPGQVAEIIVTLDGGAGRRGSGYRVGPTAVLTAAHVVEGTVSVRVRFDADLPSEWSTAAIPCWADSRSDLAVLSLAPHEGKPPMTKARFGRISARAAVLGVQAVGSPRFKLKTDDGDV
ncbi:MAG: trypsin-like peptidase domain-containing protein [Pseudonocardiaceae bacterium]